MKLLTLARDLQRRKGRERQHRFVAEGTRTVEGLLASGLPVTGVLVSASGLEDGRTAALVAQARDRGVQVLEVGDAELMGAADTESPQGILAVAPIPDHRLPTPMPPCARILVLDALQDPGNVGTVIRTAAALGVSATIALPGTVDLWNAKVVRGSMGALFHHPVLAMSWEDCAAQLGLAAFVIMAADTDGVNIADLRPGQVPDRVALVASNEGAGLSAHLASAVTQRVAIAMEPTVESLNVGVATGILLHALREGQYRDVSAVSS
ncbi:MAG TPA: RNA methyltransferase [Gemmatimonas aurantiaca]|uniref:RNA methyltransferase n=2 Tax=Gemmatimonas aurantiaca TaxID=173480 RepID=A0A3D4V4I3_9BACT|nr:RNA methyltransferase [Gemmatimonas aurantiaca]BAH39394.1 putative RNA methyltransferase [Gemmatimonas aurantiaca T-27]HCT56023.1 RNA methyltransferase [Gemmatimonas aurantiaca]